MGRDAANHEGRSLRTGWCPIPRLRSGAGPGRRRRIEGDLPTETRCSQRGPGGTAPTASAEGPAPRSGSSALRAALHATCRIVPHRSFRGSAQEGVADPGSTTARSLCSRRQPGEPHGRQQAATCLRSSVRSNPSKSWETARTEQDSERGSSGPKHRNVVTGRTRHRFGGVRGQRSPLRWGPRPVEGGAMWEWTHLLVSMERRIFDEPHERSPATTPATTADGPERDRPRRRGSR